jgi:hypothetical protein
MCHLRIPEQTAIISVRSFNWVVFKTKAEGVYSAVRTETLNTSQATLVFKGLTDEIIFMYV